MDKELYPQYWGEAMERNLERTLKNVEWLKKHWFGFSKEEVDD